MILPINHTSSHQCVRRWQAGILIQAYFEVVIYNITKSKDIPKLYVGSELTSGYNFPHDKI
ncbi:MAG TPA: hypothetical protein VI981_05330 [Candidatus Paceibacterota bacterium]